MQARIGVGGAVLSATLLATPASAGFIFIFTPMDAPHVNSPPFGPVAPGGVITTEYIDFGVDFTSTGGPDVAVFDDGGKVFAWTGVNDAGIVDLLTETNGWSVIPGPTDQGTTDMIQIEAGFVGSNDALLLEVFDTGGFLIGSTIFDDGIGPNGRRLGMLNVAGIASFRVSTPLSDTYGVDTIWLGAIVPGPGALALMAVGGVFARRRRRR